MENLILNRIKSSMTPNPFEFIYKTFIYFFSQLLRIPSQLEKIKKYLSIVLWLWREASGLPLSFITNPIQFRH